MQNIHVHVCVYVFRLTLAKLTVKGSNSPVFLINWAVWNINTLLLQTHIWPLPFTLTSPCSVLLDSCTVLHPSKLSPLKQLVMDDYHCPEIPSPTHTHILIVPHHNTIKKKKKFYQGGRSQLHCAEPQQHLFLKTVMTAEQTPSAVN